MPVAGEGVDEGRVGVEETAQAIGVAHGRGVEHVELGTGGQDQLHHDAVVAVLGGEHGRQAGLVAGGGEGRIGGEQGAGGVVVAGADSGEQVLDGHIDSLPI